MWKKKQKREEEGELEGIFEPKYHSMGVKGKRQVAGVPGNIISDKLNK